MSLTRNECVDLIGKATLDVLIHLDPSDYYDSDQILSTNEINAFHNGAALAAYQVLERIQENLINK